jgi:prolyl-tRNA editing enzyme YbaK/EbsC (Cys-tRNA(Pro) deacylase)
VAPIAHLQPLESYIDQDLLNYGELWAAAGTPNAVFRLTPGDLTRLSSGRVVDIT